jgi:sphinganine-1-phosphate aldolase
VVFLFFVLRYTRKTFDSLRGYGIIGSIKRVFAVVRLWVYYLFLRAPGVRGQVDKQVTTAITKLEEKMVRRGPGITSYLTLPKEGWTSEQIRAELTQLAGMEHAKWEEGRVSGAVYHGGEDLSKLQTEAIGTFAVSNPLHPDVFPGIRKMEAEIVAMVYNYHSSYYTSACVLTLT